MAVLEAKMVWRNRVQSLLGSIEVLKDSYAAIEHRVRRAVHGIDVEVVEPMMKQGTNRADIKNTIYDLREALGQVDWHMAQLCEQLRQAKRKDMDDDKAS